MLIQFIQCRTLVPDAITYNFASYCPHRADGLRLLLEMLPPPPSNRLCESGPTIQNKVEEKSLGVVSHALFVCLFVHCNNTMK